MSLSPSYPFAEYVEPCLDLPFAGAIAIYALYDPRDGALRYIGKSANIRERLAKHRRAGEDNASPSHRGRWLDEVRRAGCVVRALILEWATTATWDSLERAYIREARALRCPLTNTHPGGQRGGPGPRVGHPVSAATRAAISRAHKGRPASPEAIAKRKITMQGYTVSAVARANQSAALRIDPASPKAEEVRAIRRRYAAGESRAALATAFGKCRSSIDHILSGRYYPYILPLTLPRAARPRVGRSGVPGVIYVGNPHVHNKWLAVARSGGAAVTIGHFPTVEEASAAISAYHTSGRRKKHIGHAKVTPAQVRAIRDLAAQGASSAALAESFALHKSAIGRIISRKTWNHVP